MHRFRRRILTRIPVSYTHLDVYKRQFPLKGLKAICIRKKDQKSQLVHTFFGAGSKYEKNIFPRAWIEQSVEMQFEDGVFPVSAYYDELLTKLYGDYHALPNPEDRKCKEHVAILDLEHPYEAHLSELHNMQFDVLTRSIRSVSYTHLDVYKRQEYLYACGDFQLY